MSTNIKAATATGDAVLTFVETGNTVGNNGSSGQTPTTTRIVSIHALASAAGTFTIKGQRQISNKTAEGSAIVFNVAANESTDIYISEFGTPVYGVVSVSAPTDGASLTVFCG
jgi:hypothetical protein